jgi:hypothetical protein
VYRSTTVAPCASVYNTSPVLLWACRSGVPYRPRPQRCLLSSLIAFLLLTIANNPGPSNIHFGLFNAGGANHKGAGICELIHDNRLDVPIICVCESWILDDAPDAVKLDMILSNFSACNQPVCASLIQVVGGVAEDSRSFTRHRCQRII